MLFWKTFSRETKFPTREGEGLLWEHFKKTYNKTFFFNLENLVFCLSVYGPKGGC